MEIKEEDRMLFMKYAVPCAGTLVKRGKLQQEDVNNLVDVLKNDGKMPENCEKNFTVAMAACSLIAMDGGKSVVDSDVIREYFLLKHDDVIDKRYEEMGDFDPEACRTRMGIVLSVEKNRAMVLTSQGKDNYRNDFTDVKEGDSVIVHWNFIVEKLDKKWRERMECEKKR